MLPGCSVWPVSPEMTREIALRSLTYLLTVQRNSRTRRRRSPWARREQWRILGRRANKRKIGSGILAMVNVRKLILMSMGKYNDTAYLHTTKTLNYCTLIATLGIAAPLTLNTRHHNTIPYTQLAPTVVQRCYCCTFVAPQRSHQGASYLPI